MDSENQVSRRGFLKKSGMAVVGGGVISGGSIDQSAPEAQSQEVLIREHRTLGRTGFRVSQVKPRSQHGVLLVVVPVGRVVAEHGVTLASEVGAPRQIELGGIEGTRGEATHRQVETVGDEVEDTQGKLREEELIPFDVLDQSIGEVGG